MTGTDEFFGRRATIARAARLVAGAAPGLVVGTALLAGGSDGAMALAPKPDPLPQPVTITIGVGKAAHLSPLGEISGRIKEMNGSQVMIASTSSRFSAATAFGAAPWTFPAVRLV